MPAADFSRLFDCICVVEKRMTDSYSNMETREGKNGEKEAPTMWETSMDINEKLEDHGVPEPAVHVPHTAHHGDQA